MMSSDDINPAGTVNAADQPAEKMMHEDFDFDFNKVFTKASSEPPEMKEILEEAKTFGDSHRYLINALIMEPSMSTKKMNFLFAKHVTTVKLNRHPEAVIRIKTYPDESKLLSKSIVKTMNNDKGAGPKTFCSWRFVICTEEKSPKEYVIMTGCVKNSTILSETSNMTEAESALFLAIVEEMITTDGTVQLSWIHTLIRQESYKMAGVRCDAFMRKMFRQKYFTKSADKKYVEITPRILVEMDRWLRAKFSEDLKICELCRRIIGRPLYTAECKNCHVLYHYNCFKNATVISNQDSVKCEMCDEMLTLDEVKVQMAAKKDSRASHTSTGLSTGAPISLSSFSPPCILLPIRLRSPTRSPSSSPSYSPPNSPSSSPSRDPCTSASLAPHNFPCSSSKD